MVLRPASPISIAPLLLAIFFFCSFLPLRVEGIYAEKSFYVKSYVTVFQKFGFEANGTFAVTHTSFDPPEAKKSIFFYLCDADQWRTLYTSGDVKNLCSAKRNSTDPGMCELSHLMFDDVRLRNYSVRASSLYYFVALRCFGAAESALGSEGSSEERKLRGDGDGDQDETTQAMAMVAHLTDDDDISPLAHERPHAVDVRLKTDKLGFSVDVVEMTIAYTILNPGGRHLSVGNAPLPTLYSVFVAWWCWLTIMYGLVLFLKYKNRSFSLWTPPAWGAAPADGEQQVVVSLHLVLELVVVSKLVVDLSGAIYWRLCDNTGHCYVQISYFQSFVFALSESLLFAVLLLVAKGWKITRWKLPLSEVRSITVALLLLLSTLLFFSLYNESYYFFSILIMYIFMMPKIFSAVTKNLRRLSVQLAFVTRLHDERERLGQRLPPHLPRLSSLNAKLRLFQCLKATVGLYLSSFVLMSLLKMVMPWRLNWVNSFLQEMNSVLIICVIIYLLAPNVKLFSRGNMFDEESLPWLHRNILQRLLESGDEGAEGLLFLVHGDRRGDGPLLSGDGSGKVDFGDGNVNDLADLVVFEFPRARQPESVDIQNTSCVGGVDGKGKALENEEANGGTVDTKASVVGVSGRYLAIGAAEQFVDREAARRAAEDKEAEEMKKQAKGNARRGRDSEGEAAGGEETQVSRPNGDDDLETAVQQQDEEEMRREDNWQRRRWLLLRGRERSGASGEGGNEEEIELVTMRRGRRHVGVDDQVEMEAGRSPVESYDEGEEEEEDLEKGTEKRSLLPSSSSSSSSSSSTYP